MREILFKAKRMDNGEWVEGYYVKAELLNCTGSEHCIIEYSSKGGTHLIDPETVCQYTGMTDKNGVNIFEGDKCVFLADTDPGSYREETAEMYTVFWDVDDGRWSVKESEHGATDSLDWFFADHCTVSGNIHDDA